MPPTLGGCSFRRELLVQSCISLGAEGFARDIEYKWISKYQHHLRYVFEVYDSMGTLRTYDQAIGNDSGPYSIPSFAAGDRYLLTFAGLCSALAWFASRLDFADLDKQMDGCHNYGPLLGPLNTRCRIVIGTRKGTIVLTTTQMPRKDCSTSC